MKKYYFLKGDIMVKKMVALVKERPEPGLWMRKVEMPEVGPNDVLIKIKKNVDMRNRSSHLQLEYMVAKDNKNSNDYRS